MFELIFELSSHVDTTIFYGINNVNIQLIKNLYPNLKIIARGHIIKIMGSEEEADKLFLNLQKLEQYSIENNKLTEKNIIDLIK
ncbi:MAG TPA: phosphate starvation-inducible protein PhoH, partial [Paludibacteraceae bacterium]|nr:phosphate starvation-inducible protein PhoH [Paludibacteraceae bacterium]